LGGGAGGGVSAGAIVGLAIAGGGGGGGGGAWGSGLSPPHAATVKAVSARPAKKFVRIEGLLPKARILQRPLSFLRHIWKTAPTRFAVRMSPGEHAFLDVAVAGGHD
jgi:hypothetical protein